MRTWAGLAAIATATAVLAACGGDSGSEPPAAAPPPAGETAPPAQTDAGGEAPRGGVYRIGVESSFSFTDGFDPTGEYLSTAWQLYSNLLLRPLLSYKHVAGPEGNELLPDLAEDFPEVSADGLTYTFHLKDGVKFSPPLDREITSRDVAYAFERIGTPDLVAQYGFYYSVIEGMDAFSSGEADSISGIETPDDKTIVFHLAEPAGDFPFHVAMPAAAPIPEEVAGCFDQAGEYGRFVIASGPYMLEGSEDLDVSSCAAMTPIAGYDPNTHLILVRNPSYDPATDTPEMREALPDRFELVINTNRDDIFAKIKAGELEGEISTVPPKLLREYSESEELQDRLHLNPLDATWYLSMNLTTPPFDDLHVRRAVNLVMDKEGLRRAWGGPLRGEIATHVVPNAMLNDLRADYDPYPSEGAAGDVEAAMEEMRQSKYDTDGDGSCDAPPCTGVLHIAVTTGTNTDMIPIIESSLAKIGITLETRATENGYVIAQTISKNVPITSALGWFKDYADASTFMQLFDSRNTAPTGNVNHSLVGATCEQAAEWKGFEGVCEGVPSVDADIDRCRALAGDERLECWAELDAKLMEEVVPWVPYLYETAADVVSGAVVQYGFDQFMGEAALAHVAVDASKQ